MRHSGGSLSDTSCRVRGWTLLADNGVMLAPDTSDERAEIRVFQDFFFIDASGSTLVQKRRVRGESEMIRMCIRCEFPLDACECDDI